MCVNLQPHVHTIFIFSSFYLIRIKDFNSQLICNSFSNKPKYSIIVEQIIKKTK